MSLRDKLMRFDILRTRFNLEIIKMKKNRINSWVIKKNKIVLVINKISIKKMKFFKVYRIISKIEKI